MKYIISGHEKFSLRYPWLPKTIVALSINPCIFSDEDQAIVEMGVGKNMVRSIKFWATSTNVIEKNGANGYVATEFGKTLFNEDGLDPYLEDIKTLWLLHWNLSVVNSSPLLAWDFLLNRWHEPEMSQSLVLKAILEHFENADPKPSETTLRDHLSVFIHTYFPTRGNKGEIKEENLDSPLTEIELLQKSGSRESIGDSGKLEPVYKFRREEKPEISEELFLYCLYDFITRKYPHESTVAFREIAHGNNSPGQIFKLPETDMRHRLEGLVEQTGGHLSYIESSNIQQVRKNNDLNLIELLKQIY